MPSKLSIHIRDYPMESSIPSVRVTLAAGPKDGWIAHPAPRGAAKLSAN